MGKRRLRVLRGYEMDRVHLRSKFPQTLEVPITHTPWSNKTRKTTIWGVLPDKSRRFYEACEKFAGRELRLSPQCCSRCVGPVAAALGRQPQAADAGRLSTCCIGVSCWSDQFASARPRADFALQQRRASVPAFVNGVRLRVCVPACCGVLQQFPVRTASHRLK
jgi:hypothetical protein